MLDIIQTFFTYIGLTFFITGVFFCFIAQTFRFGVFCTLVGNLLFCSAIVFPKQIIEFIKEYQLLELFTSVNMDVLKEKAIITGLIFIALLWSVRWFKHVLVEGALAFVFPSLYQPKIKE